MSGWYRETPEDVARLNRNFRGPARGISMAAETLETPVLAWSRTGPGHQARAVSTDHATIDGRTTLCGIREIGGHDPATTFNPGAAFSCKRCARRVLEHGR